VLAGAGEALVIRAADSIVTIAVLAAFAAITGAALLAGAVGGDGAHAIGAASVIGARVAVVAVFGAVTAIAAGVVAAGRMRAGLTGRTARRRWVSAELRAATAAGRLHQQRYGARDHEAEAVSKIQALLLAK
jgi:hypothetical protein